MVQKLAKDEFLEKIKSDQLVVVDFYADWCGPCKQMAVIIDELAETYQGKVSFAKVDIEFEQGLAADYGITSVPTFLFFRSGEKVASYVGSSSKDVMTERIEKEL